MSDSDDETERSNLEAYLALSQFRADVVAPLVNLLRSEGPIDPSVRNAIADALEAKTKRSPIVLQVLGQNSGPLAGWAGRRRRFARDMAIGRFVAALREPPRLLTLDAAELEAERRYGIGVKTCHAATIVQRRAMAWLDQHMPMRPPMLSSLTDANWLHHQECTYFDVHKRGL